MRTALKMLAICINSVAFFLAGQTNADIFSDLLHHWKFDESSGDVAADSAGHNDGSLFNWEFVENRWVAGKVGGALDFGDLDNYVITDSPISLNQYTIAFWLKVSAKEGINPRILGPSDGLHHWIIIGNEDDLGVGFYFNHGAVHVQDPNPPVLGEWEHYAIVFDRAVGQASIYRDGSIVSSGNFSDDLPLGSWVLGHQGDVNNHNDSLNGLLDDVRIYNRLLDATDIVELASIPEPSTVTSVLAVAVQFLILRLRPS